MLVRSEVTAGRVGAMYLLHGHFVLCWLCFLSYVNFYAVRVLAQQPRLSSCLEIKLNEQFPTFDIVLAQNVTDDRNGGVLVAHMADKLFRLASRVERSQELNGSVAVAVIEASYFGDADGMWQYKNSTDAVWTAFPIGLSDSNALLITRRGFIRFVPNADYFNFPVRDMPSPRLVFHGWNGFGSNNNISDVAIENCVFSRFTVKTFVTVLRLNFVRAVEITPFSMKLEVNVQLTDNITNGAIQYKLKSFGICGAWSVTERVEDALASAIGGVFTHEIHLLQPSTEYTPQIVFPAASDTSDGFPVMTAPDVVQNVEVKGVTNSSDVIISWEPFQSEVLLMYIVVIDGREGMFIPMQRPRQLRQSLSPFGFDDGFSVFDTETVTLNALKSSSIYEVRVAAADGSRDFSPAPGPFSPPVLFETNVTRRPGPPGYVKLYQACCHTLAVQWEFPFEPEGPITEFVVELFEDDQPSFSSSQFSTSVTERSHVFTSVFGGDFYATVRARNSRGLGENATSPTVTLTAPAPAPRLGVPFEFTVENVTDVSAIVVITFELRPEGPPPLFNVLLYPNDDCRKGDPNNSTNVSSRVYSAIGLHPFTAYSVCVWESKRPLNTSVIGFFITDQSTPTGRTTVQDVSHVMSVVARTDSVLLRWTPVDKPNGVIGYEVIVEQLEGLSIERPSLLLDPNLLPPPGQDNPYYQWRVTGLEAGVGYNFTVQPYNLKYNTTGDGTSIVVFTFIGRPGPPSISLRTNATDTSVTVRWDPPAKKNGEILSYGITLVVDDVNSTSGCLMHREQQFVSVSPQQGGLLEYTFTSLMPNTSYVTTIRAKTAAGYGEMSPPFGVVTLPLVSAPTPGGPCLVAGCSDFSTCVLQSSDVIQCSCNEGFIGDGYRCVDLPVLVVRKRSESEIHISFRDLRRGDIRLLNNTVVKFQLFTPDNQLVRSDQRPFQLKINESTRLEVARVVFRELQPGVKYNLSYSFPIGSIVHTKTAMVTTQSSVPQAPPMDIIIAVVTNISATLSWRPPPRAFNNGPLTGYDVMASNLFTINGLFVSLRRKTASNMTSVKIDGLLPFNKYEVRVAAHTSAGRGPWSDSKHFTTKSATPGPPRIDDAFDVFNGSNPVVYMSWRYPAVPGGEITHFLIHEFIGEGDPLEELGSPSSVGPAENVFLLEDLGRNWRVPQRQVRVQAGSNSSLGILAAEDVPRSPRQFFDPESASVTNITQSESGNFSVTVSWPPVNITDFLLLHGIPPGALIEYQVFPLRGARNCKDPPPNVPLILNINITSAVLPDLFSNSIYSVCVRVRAFRELTSVVARTFVITPQSVPGPVVNLSSQSVSSESAELTWLPPVSPNGVIGYRVQVKEINGSHAFSVLMQPSSLVTSDEDTTVGLLLSGLNGNRTYSLSVMAYNLKSGRNGQPVSIDLKTMLGTPHPPENVTAISAGPDSITILWFPSVSDGVVGYQISSVMANATDENLLPVYFVSYRVKSVSAATLQDTIDGLEPNTKYALWVKTMGLETTSQPSEVVFQRTEVLVTTPEPVSSQPPTPSSQCLSARCSKNATCVPQSSGLPRCDCVTGFAGDGYICVELPRFKRNASTSDIHILLTIQYGDFQMLNDTDVMFRLFTPDPDGQLVQRQQSPFQFIVDVISGIPSEIRNQVSFEELQPGVNYTLKYSFSIGSFKHSNTVKAATLPSVPLAPPTDVRITEITNSSATVSWQRPPRAFNSGPLTGYDVNVRSLFAINGSVVNITKTTGDVTSVQINDLFPFQKHVVSVAAHTSAGRGPWSDGRQFTTKSATPGPPRIDDAFDVFNGSNAVVYTSWRYPAVPGGEITHFLIHALIGEGDTPGELGSPSSVGAAENFFLLENLGRNREFLPPLQVGVQAGSNSSLGILAAKDVLQPGQVQPTPGDTFPGVSPSGLPKSASVTNRTQSESGNFTVTVSWPAVNITDFLSLHGLPQNANIEYQVFHFRGAGECGARLSNVPLNISSTSVVLPDLLPNSIYSVCVMIVYEEFEFISVVAITFLRTPQSVPGPVVNLSSQSISSESAELTWLPPLSPNGVIGYRVQVKEINGRNLSPILMQPSSLITSDEDTTVGLLLIDLNGNRTYSLSVMAYNLKSGRNGQPVSIDLKTMLGTPHPPENVTAISAGPDSITILWFPSVSDGVVGYQISSVMANATDENLLPVYFVSYRVKSVSAATLQDTIHGLEPNTKYALWVKTMGLETTSRPGEVVFQRTEVLVTTPEPVSSQPPTPSSQCPSARCSKNATCVPQSSGSPRCVCVDGFVGDGYICVELPRFKRSASTSDIHILLTIQYGDFRMLNNTDVTFQLFTPDPDGQLVQIQQNPFQLTADVISGIQSVIQSQVSFNKELQPGVTYTLKYSFSIGSIKYSDTIKAATLPSVPLAPPTDVIITEITNSSATVSWQRPPRAFNSGPLTGYDVNVRSLFAINGSVVNITKTTGDVTSVQINDLFPFQKHVVSVAAHTSAGRGPWSDGRQFTTKSATPGPPRIDDAFDVFNGSNAVVYTSWRYPAVPGGEITHFLIHALIGEGDTPGELGSPSSVGAAENFFLLENLGRNREFLPPLQVGVQAGSNSSLGILAAKDVLQPGQVQPTSGQVQPTPGESFLEFSNGVSPSGLPKSASVTNRTQSESGNFTVTVSWPAVNITDFLSLHELPQNANIEYQVFHFRGAGECAHGAHLSNVPLNISSTSVVLPDLLPNSIYSICVMIVYEEFEFISVVAITFVRTPQSVPGPVVNLSSQSISSESAELTWLPPLSPNGVIGYRVQVKEINGRNLPPILMQPSSLITSDGYTTVGLLLSDLNGNRTYSLSVMAYNLESDRDGQPMSLELKTKLGTPRPPENVTATSDGPDAITVHWFPSVSDGVVKYQITVVMANATENKLPDYFVSPHVEEVSATTTTYTVSDLKPNTKYAAFMKAMGLEAASQPSEVVFQETKDVTRLSICGVRCILSEARGITFREFTIQLGQEIANSTAQLIKNDSLEPDELRTVNSILESLVDLQERALSAGILLTPSDTYIDTFIELSSIILDLQQEDSWHALNSSEGAPLFLNTLERYSRIIAASYSFSDGSSSKNFSSDNLVLTVNNITKSTVRSISFPSGRLSHFSSSSQGNMVISASLLSQLLQQPNVTRLLVSNMIFQNLQQYMPSSTSGESLSVGEQRKSSSELPSTVLVSASIVEDVVGQSYNPNYTTRTLPESVTIAYSNIEPNSSANYTCSFWQFETNSSPGQWSSSGVTTKQLNDTNVLCTSTHLTSFSVLVSVKSSVSSDTLTYITYIGCGISLLSLLITLVVLVAFRSYLLFERNFININFVVALMLALIFFLAGIDQSSNREVCKAMTVILHYFFLAVFCWMLCEGYLLYLLLVVVFDSGRSHAKRYFAFGWGLPLLIVGISLGVRYDEYGAYDYCFLTHHKGLIWAFVGPMAAILLVNLAVFIKAVKIVVSKANRSVNKDKLHVVKSGLKAMGVFLPVLGLTWGIGVFAIDTLSLPLAYVFTVLNSLQGLFVFIFHCLLNRQLRKAITTIRQKREQTKLMEKSIGTSSTGTGTASQPKARRRRSHKYEVAAVTDESTVEMQHVELHQFTQKDMDNLESFDTQVTTLKVETSIGYGNSMTSVRSDEPLKKSSDSSSGKDSQDSSPEFSPKSGQFRDNDGSQEEQLYNRDEGRPIQAIIPEQTLIPLSSSDSQSHYPAENALPLIKSLLNDGSRSSIDTVQSVSAADCMVIPRGASHAVIIQQGNNDRISDAQDLSTSERGSRDRFPSTNSDSNSADVRQERFI